MTICPNCESEQSQASKFCSECGVSLIPDIAATMAHASGSSAAEAASRTSSDSSHHGRFLPGMQVAGRYRIVALLGKGGMGEVYRADDLKLGHTVALKFLPQNLANDSRRLEYLHSEVRLTRQVSHPNVCRVYDIGEVDGQQFLSMEYVDGEDLKTLLRRIGRLPRDKGIQIAQQLCAGLAAAHERGVLHRDLKPMNIMIDGRGQVRITDFGLAKLVDDERPGEVAGTPAYMAPEQLRHGQATIQSDLYSLGLVLYELFTGEAANKARSIQELLATQEESSFSQPSSLVDDMDPAVESVIARCLEKDPQDRPKSARAVSAALPGGDPLAAALAAGETPSPQMVAAADKTGSLSMQWGVSLLVLTIAALLIRAAVISYLISLADFPPQKAPNVLESEAQQLLTELGYQFQFSDSASGFVPSSLTEMWWLRQSQEKLIPQAGLGVVTLTDPPFLERGQVSVVLDMAGRLVELQVVEPGDQPPPALEASQSEERLGRLFEAAGFDRDSFTIDADYLPDADLVIPHDQSMSWIPRHDDPQLANVRIHGATLHGMPVFFRQTTIAGQSLVTPAQDTVKSTGTPLGAGIALFWIAINVVSVFLAWRNLRAGRGDRHGAARVALTCLALGIFAGLLVARHWGTGLTIMKTFEMIIAVQLQMAAFAWAFYMAVEPYMRREWPDRIISSTRLLAGNFADSLVGRDLLLGVLIGMVANLLFLVAVVVAVAFELEVGSYWSLNDLQAQLSAMHVTSAIAGSTRDAIADSLSFMYAYIVILTVVRRRKAAVVSMIAFLVAIILVWPSGGHIAVVIMLGLVWVAYNSLALFRFGLLALASALASHKIGALFQPSLDFSRWDAGYVWFANGLLVALAAYGCYTATLQRKTER